MPSFAANLSLLFTEWPVPDRFAAARDAGFTLAEMQFPYDEPADLLARRARAAGVDLVLINAPPGEFADGERGLACLTGDDARFGKSVDEAIRYAEALGAGLVHVMAGQGDATDAATFDRYRRRVATAADRLAAHDIRTVVEPINGRDMPGYLLNDFALAERLLHQLDRPHLRLLFDIYHREMMTGDAAAGLNDLLPLVGHVQIAGVPGRHEPDNGELDYVALLRQLDALGYDGVVGCEYRPRNGTIAGLGWLERMGG